MIFYLVLFAFALAAAWLLWRAFTRGEVVGRFGEVITRAKSPISFWVIVAINIVVALSFGVGAAVQAYRTAFPALPEWAQVLYPTRAQAQKVEGLVILRCTVTPAYGVKDCVVASETPAGMGFGASALQISALEVLPRKDRARAQPGQSINLPIRFKMPEERP